MTLALAGVMSGPLSHDSISTDECRIFSLGSFSREAARASLLRSPSYLAYQFEEKKLAFSVRENAIEFLDPEWDLYPLWNEWRRKRDATIPTDLQLIEGVSIIFIEIFLAHKFSYLGVYALRSYSENIFKVSVQNLCSQM